MGSMPSFANFLSVVMAAVSTIRMGTRPLLLHRPEEVLLGVPVHVTIQLALQLFTQLQGQPLELGP